MLKKFFISMLGTMAGIWISLALLVFASIMLAGVIAGKSSDSGVKIKKKSILHFELSGSIADRYQPASFMQIIQMDQSSAPTLDEMLTSLRLATNDSKIDGLYLDCRGSLMGTASRQELLEAIEEFKNAGKWVYAYADTYSQGDYLLASSADAIALNPVGSIDIHGVGAIVPFYKGLLDKLGVKVQVLKVGTYKSAVEPYILDRISEPARQQMVQYCDTLWNFISQTISANRDFSESRLRSMASEMMFTYPADSLSGALVDTLVYRRQNKEILANLSDIDVDKDPRLVTPKQYLADKDILGSLDNSKRHIAVLYALGDISDSGDEGIVGEKMTEEIVNLADDDNVAGLVMRVNSPGGSAFASEQIWSALEYFKSKDKPFYVSMGDYAASGGYYISCGADTIFADRTTITGSIGVFGLIPDFSGLVTDKLGVNFSTVETNPNAAGIDVFQSMTPAQHEAMQRSVENIYELFTKRVADGRGIPQDEVKKIAEGRVWIGSDAIGLGLVDRLGSLQKTIDAMADELAMSPGDIKEYPALKEEFWQQLLRENIDFNDLKAAGYDREAMKYINTIRRLRNAAPVQARMPEVFIK